MKISETTESTQASEPPADAGALSAQLSDISISSLLPVNHVISNTPLQQLPEADLSAGRQKLRKWLGKTFRVVITDGRVLVGFFNCTDKDANIVLSMCAEYLEEGKDARILGNVMIPGKHIVSISVDMPKEEATQTTAKRSTSTIEAETTTPIPAEISKASEVSV